MQVLPVIARDQAGIDNTVDGRFLTLDRVRLVSANFVGEVESVFDGRRFPCLDLTRLRASLGLPPQRLYQHLFLRPVPFIVGMQPCVTLWQNQQDRVRGGAE